MQTILLPSGIVSSIEKIIKDFLWGSKDGERKCHVAKRDTITRSKAHGGFGIRKLEPMNLAFLAKLGWRLVNNEDSLWIQMFKHKYATDPWTYLPGNLNLTCLMPGRESLSPFPYSRVAQRNM